MRLGILAVSNAETHTAKISRLNFELAELYARAVLRAMKRWGPVELIGCHGQTVFHEGRSNTLQLGEPAVLAERTGVPVVSNFRARDIAAGGQGAPLVPFVDYLLFRHAKRTRIALNIGGIANITVIPPGAAPGEVIAFDTGPGNMVIDALARDFSKGTLSCDRGGRIAESGQVNGKLLDELLKDPYYRRKPPKSAGREQYGAEFVARLTRTGLPAADLIATATVLTAATIAMGIGETRRRPDCFGRRRAQSANHGAPFGILAGHGDLHLDRPRDRCRCQRGYCIRGAGGPDLAREARKSTFSDGRAVGSSVGKRYALKSPKNQRNSGWTSVAGTADVTGWPTRIWSQL